MKFIKNLFYIKFLFFCVTEINALGGTSYILASGGTSYSDFFEDQPQQVSLNIASQVADSYPSNAYGCARVKAPLGCKVTFVATFMHTEADYDVVTFYSSISPLVRINKFSGLISPASNVYVT